MTSDKIQGFKVLTLRFSSSSTSYHQLFIKEHSVRLSDDSKPIGQTLFVLNIPPYITEDQLKSSFSLAGKIRQVVFDDSEDNFARNDGFKRGYIVFHSREALLKAMKLTNLNLESTSGSIFKMGIEKWVDEYNASIKCPEELQKEIDDFMKNFDEQEKSKKSEITDDNGWTVVTKGGRKPGLSRKESMVNKLDAKSIKKMKKKELKNFYTFQIRESQMKNIVELRKNYAEAKDKVRLMKAARKFKPY